MGSRRSPWARAASAAAGAAFSLAAAGAAIAIEPPRGLDAYLPAPADNPLAPERIALGRDLFFDKRLSRDGSLSCAGCHRPELAFTDDEPLAVGVDGRRGTRRTPRLVNRAYGRSFFWDGRAPSLEEQVLKPIGNPIEMDLSLEEAVGRLRADAGYDGRFREAFGGEPDARGLAWALAGYVRSILSGDSPYDRYLAGDVTALDAAQRRGLELFRGKAACSVCHLGPNLTDEAFHNTGVGWKNGAADDQGRAAATGRAADRGAFKTPSLREAARGGPYMHDGSLATLADVVDFYDRGGQPNPNLDPDMQPLDLSDEEKRDLLAFLGALSGTLREGP